MSRLSMSGFAGRLAAAGMAELRARSLTTLQVNLGKLCNQACRHCHVDAGPHRLEPQDNMQQDVVAQVLRVLGDGGITTLDITGGAPELHPDFRRLVAGARALGLRVIDRCNLTILSEPGQEDLAGFVHAHQVEVTASLPYFNAERTDRQRGTGVFAKSIEGLRRLNELGYGAGDPRWPLNLVYNPVGAYLPPAQAAIEADFRRELHKHQVTFDRLFCITNMPIARFLDWLRRTGNEATYLAALQRAFNPKAAEEVMCRDLVSVGPDGRLWDCDFHQMAGTEPRAGVPATIWGFDRDALARREIAMAEHCFGCTAGAGSSCGGELVG